VADETSLSLLEDIMDLKEKVKNLPGTPGIYLMKDSDGSIIYVGKSKNLKSRVGSYFQNSKSHSPKVVKMVKHLKDFEYILTDTEFEAFMLECKLIKELKPLYNRLMKNPLSYTYIKIKTGDKYPSIDISNEPNEDDGCIYYGPYTNKNATERAVQGIKESCKLICSSPSRSGSSCLNYSLGLCLGMCMDDDALEQYTTAINSIISLLNGTDRKILEVMEEKMNSAAEKFDFETAAKYRDYIGAASSLLNKAKVIEFAEENKNIAMVEPLGDRRIKLFLIKANKVLFSQSYELSDSNLEYHLSDIKNYILYCFKISTPSPTTDIGKDEIDEAHIIYSYLKSSNCRYVIISEDWLQAENMTDLNGAVRSLLLP
jgi:excinuclease ABC subunit C